MIGGITILSLADMFIDKFFPNKTKALEAKMQVREAEERGELADIQGRWNAMIAESKSQDKWTSRARPSIIYTMCIFILCAIPFCLLYAFYPVIAKQMVEGMNLWLTAIPNSVWGTFGAATCVYIGARSYDKRGLKK